MRESLKTQILVVGGGTGGTAAAIQAARRGAQVVLVSEFPWLGGMLTSAGVAAPDGNELEAFQTGFWGGLSARTAAAAGGLGQFLYLRPTGWGSDFCGLGEGSAQSALDCRAGASGGVTEGRSPI